ncbi:uncharacterized protein LOC112589571 isoform X2 [Harpegnathos saltator]|uniref:uncharacterized protein LOC112589571 isoform X2 n=1 Tax=Harpegnathos saltator TaxID=610380 RepID=UPI000DBEDC32|nr:uncharacterized protein LOC112589571 isoform X2 [Harpegnathos saltator]
MPAVRKYRRDTSEVSCCLKYVIFGFNVMFWVSPPIDDRSVNSDSLDARGSVWALWGWVSGHGPKRTPSTTCPASQTSRSIQHLSLF